MIDLLALLKRIERSGTEIGFYRGENESCCPDCREADPKHTKDCELKRAIDLLTVYGPLRMAEDHD